MERVSELYHENKTFKLVKVFVDREYSPDLSFKCNTLPRLLCYKVDEQGIVAFYKPLRQKYTSHFTHESQVECKQKGTH